MISAGELDQLLRDAAIPITGCAIGNPGDKTTWRVDFDPSATQAHRDQAAALIAAYVPPTPGTLFDRFAEQRITEKALIASVTALWESIPNPTMTKGQLKARAIAIFKTL